MKRDRLVEEARAGKRASMQGLNGKRRGRGERSAREETEKLEGSEERSWGYS